MERAFLYYMCKGNEDGDDEKKITLTRADRPPPQLDFNQEQKKKRAKPCAACPHFLFSFKLTN